MNKLEHAARQALEALGTLDCGDSYKTHNAATALREALAELKKPEECENGCPSLQVCDYCQRAEQAEQEPVYKLEVREFRDGFFGKTKSLGHNLTPLIKTGRELAVGVYKLYTAPVMTKDLTDDEAQKLWHDTSSIVPMWAHHLHFARAVIAAYKEKNK